MTHNHAVRQVYLGSGCTAPYTNDHPYISKAPLNMSHPEIHSKPLNPIQNKETKGLAQKERPWRTSRKSRIPKYKDLRGFYKVID